MPPPVSRPAHVRRLCRNRNLRARARGLEVSFHQVAMELEELARLPELRGREEVLARECARNELLAVQARQVRPEG
eukprot:2208243-Rhodomonas_salina.1